MPLDSAELSCAPPPAPLPAPVVRAIALLRAAGRDASRHALRADVDEATREAVAAVYRCFAPDVRRLIDPIVGPIAADDVLHALFCQLPALAAHYREGSFEEWLWVVAARAARAARQASEAAPPRVAWSRLGARDALLERILETLGERTTGPPGG